MALGPTYRRLWTASTLSAFGSGIFGAGMPLFAARLTNDPTAISAMTIAGQLPALLFGMVAGSVVDRVNRRRLIVLLGFGNAVLSGIAAALVGSGAATLLILYGFAFSTSTMGIFSDNALTTMTPTVVDPDHLDRANSRLISASTAGSYFLGPPAGSFLFEVLPALPFGIGSCTRFASALLRLGLPNPPAADRSRIDIVAGLRWLLRNRRIRAITALTMLLALTDNAWFPLMVLYVRDVLHLPPGRYGLVVGIGGIGEMLGGICASRLARTCGQARVLIGAVVLAAVGQAILGLTADVVLTVFALALSSFLFGVWDVVTTTVLQTVTPAPLLGRVLGAERTLAFAAAPLGSLVGGLAAAAYGLRVPFLAGVPALLVGAVFGTRALRAERR